VATTTAPDPPVGAAPEVETPSRLGPPWDRRLFWGALVLALVPLAVSAVVAVQELDSSYHPAGDLAAIQLKTDDVLRHPVPTGLFSRDRWDHPGPAMFYVLALPYRLSGSEAWGLHVGALLVNGASIVGMALIARRRGGTPVFLLTLLGAGLLVQALGPDFVRDPWNPLLPVLPFGLLVMLAWEMTSGSTWALPVATAVAWFCIQTHVGYALLAGPVLIWGAAWLVVSWRRSGTPPGPSLLRAGVVAGLVSVVMWLPPVAEQLFGEEGNLRAILSYFLDPGEESHTLTEGYRLVSGQFGWPPHWMTFWADNDFLSGEPRLLRRSVVPVFLVALVAAGIVLWRKRVPRSRPFLLTIALVLALGVLWVVRTLGPVFGYRVAWTSVLGMISFVPIGWAVWVVVTGRFGRRASAVLAGIALAGIAVLGVKNAASATEPPVTSFQEDWSEDLATTIPDVLRALPEREGDVVLRCDADKSCIYMAGLFLELEERGLRPRVREFDGLLSSNAKHRVHEDGPVRAALHVSFTERFGLPAERDGARLVAYSGPLPAEEAARVAARIREVEDLYARGEISDLDRYVERVDLFRRLGHVVGVYVERA
jgi:hypothetical protein